MVMTRLLTNSEKKATSPSPTESNQVYVHNLDKISSNVDTPVENDGKFKKAEISKKLAYAGIGIAALTFWYARHTAAFYDELGNLFRLFQWSNIGLFSLLAFLIAIISIILIRPTADDYRNDVKINYTIQAIAVIAAGLLTARTLSTLAIVLLLIVPLIFTWLEPKDVIQKRQQEERLRAREERDARRQAELLNPREYVRTKSLRRMDKSGSWHLDLSGFGNAQCPEEERYKCLLSHFNSFNPKEDLLNRWERGYFCTFHKLKFTVSSLDPEVVLDDNTGGYVWRD
jgi:hypothetical protein